MATQQPRDRTGPIHRIKGSDFSTAEAVFEAAMVLITPDDQSQRKAFEALVPYIYVLRDMGCSWAQITKLLVDTGLKLQPSTVRSYYSEMLADRQDICQQKMKKQILMMAEIRNSTKEVDLSPITTRATAICEKHLAASSQKNEAIFGTDKSTSPVEIPSSVFIEN